MSVQEIIAEIKNTLDARGGLRHVYFVACDFEKMNRGRIDPAVAEFFAPVVLIPIERWYVYQMSLITEHDMDMRRYMYKVEY